MIGSMAPTINLDEVADAMDQWSESTEEPLLDRETGHVVVVPDFDWTGVEDPELERAIEAEPDRFLPIPRFETRLEYEWMAVFCESIGDADARAKDRIADALRGKGAFRRFKDVLYEYPALRERWFAERNDYAANHASAWLKSEGVAFEPCRRQITKQR